MPNVFGRNQGYYWFFPYVMAEFLGVWLLAVSAVAGSRLINNRRENVTQIQRDSAHKQSLRAGLDTMVVVGVPSMINLGAAAGPTLDCGSLFSTGGPSALAG